jgi:hypothetical protein
VAKFIGPRQKPKKRIFPKTFYEAVAEQSHRPQHPITNGLGLKFVGNLTPDDMERIISSLPAKDQAAIMSQRELSAEQSKRLIGALSNVYINSLSVGLPSYLSKDFAEELRKGKKEFPRATVPAEIFALFTPGGGPARALERGGKAAKFIADILLKTKAAKKLPKVAQDIAASGMTVAGAMGLEEVVKLDKLREDLDKGLTMPEALANSVNRGLDAADTGFKFGAGIHAAAMGVGFGVQKGTEFYQKWKNAPINPKELAKAETELKKIEESSSKLSKEKVKLEQEEFQNFASMERWVGEKNAGIKDLKKWRQEIDELNARLKRPMRISERKEIEGQIRSLLGKAKKESEFLAGAEVFIKRLKPLIGKNKPRLEAIESELSELSRGADITTTRIIDLGKSRADIALEKQSSQVEQELVEQGLIQRKTKAADDIATVIGLGPTAAEDFRLMTGGVNIEDIAARNGLSGHLVDLANRTTLFVTVNGKKIPHKMGEAWKILTKRNAIYDSAQMDKKVSADQIHGFFKDGMKAIAAKERRLGETENLLAQYDARKQQMLDMANRPQGLNLRDLQNMVDDYEIVEGFGTRANKTLEQATNSALDKTVNIAIRQHLRNEIPELGRLNQDLAGFMRIRKSTGISEQARGQGKAKGLPSNAKELTTMKLVEAPIDWLGRRTGLNNIPVFDWVRGTRISEGTMKKHRDYVLRREATKENLIKRKALMEAGELPGNPGVFEKGSELLMRAADDIQRPNSQLRNKLTVLADKTNDRGLLETVDDFAAVGSAVLRAEVPEEPAGLSIKDAVALGEEEDFSDLDAEFGEVEAELDAEFGEEEAPTEVEAAPVEEEEDFSDLDAEFGGEREPQAIAAPPQEMQEAAPNIRDETIDAVFEEALQEAQ